MQKFTTLLGLSFGMIGVAILIRDEITSKAAILRQSSSKARGGWFTKIAFSAAKKFGSTNPQDQEDYIGESFTKRFWGFILILFGFLAQAFAVLI